MPPHEQAAISTEKAPPAAVVPHAIARRVDSVDPLLARARIADDAQTRDADKPLSRRCGKDIATYCLDDVKLVQKISGMTNNDVNSPFLVEALRNVNVCLASNSAVLSPPCLDAMIAEFLGGSKRQQPDDDKSELSDNRAADRGGKHRIRRSWKDDDDDSEEDSKSRTKGVSIYVINDGEGFGYAAGEAIGYHRRRGHRSRDDDDESVHPLVWVVMLPFFCVGVYVTAKKALAYYKERRGGLPFATPSHQYEPLKAPESPTASQ